MKKVELLKIGTNLLKIMSDNDIKASDVPFIAIYEEFQQKRQTLKYSAVISELAEKYKKVKEL